MNSKKKCAATRTAARKYTGKGGFGATVVPAKLGQPPMTRFDPSMTRANYKSWSGESLPAANTPAYSRSMAGLKLAGPIAAAYAGSIEIGKLAKGILNYKKELNDETESYNRAGELADKLRQRYIAKRKK